jgi:hypothetical protein
MKQVRVAAMFFLLCMPALSFASVVAGDDYTIVEPGIGSVYSRQSDARSFIPLRYDPEPGGSVFQNPPEHSRLRAYPSTIQEALP